MKSTPGHFLPVPAAARWLTLLVSCGALVLFPGCQRPAAEPAPAAAEAPVAAQQEATPSSEDIWDVFYLQGSKIGYGHTVERPVRRDGRWLVEIDSLNHLTITRFGQKSEQEVKMSTLETPEGQLLDFTTEATFGPTPTVVRGRVEGDVLQITTETQGRQDTARMPWSSDVQGFRAIEQSLARRPMQPGQSRSLRMLMPIVNQIADVDLSARDYEPTPVLGLETRLLRVDAVARLPGGQTIESTAWTDAEGQVIKTLLPALSQESFRTTKKIALAPATGAGTLDLGLDLFVHVEPPLENPHGTREVRYQVELTDGDPAKVFATGPTQSVRSTGPHTAEITVRSMRPGQLPPAEASANKPGPEYTDGNTVLQLDDRRIREMAAEARGKLTKPADIALALERYVHDAVSEKNFSHGFATAAEVAQSREGDCTEHAVLLAALARVCGIPSRVAIGLVYVDRAGGFGYHMWTEVYLDGQWVPLDAIMGRGGTSAAYLKLNDASLAGASAYSSFLSVAQVLGQLKVSVLSAE